MFIINMQLEMCLTKIIIHICLVPFHLQTSKKRKTFLDADENDDFDDDDSGSDFDDDEDPDQIEVPGKCPHEPQLRVVTQTTFSC